ncbi:MAG: bifunctional 2-polyprenyl-6-hydroxyphenol methylase/3-demethylubiquinol 3-O-methyltransferase UbiG [Bacteriovoracia bacterium]
METSLIDNSIYNLYGDRWYTAFDDPIALLRAENEAKYPWIKARLGDARSILDVGCGAGFLTNRLAQDGYTVTGLDLSGESLAVARRFDTTKSVNYVEASAYELPFPDESFDAVTSLDFLEHVTDPEAVVRECARVLRPGGLFFFHTFNRNPVAEFVVIKLVEKLVKNTPKHMHVIELFITPQELFQYCEASNLTPEAITGLKPKFSTVTLESLRTGVVPRGLEFETTKSLLISYLGAARKVARHKT